jgi:integrase
MELAASTGLRRGELFALRWQHIDFEQRLINVVDSKTEAGERQVPMFGSARKVLLEQRARSPYKEPQHFVFGTEAGTAVHANSWMMREFCGAMKRADMEWQFRFHDLRHYAVSCLVQQGANVLLVSRVAGHSRPSMTLDVYSHSFDEELAQAALRFDPLATTAAQRETRHEEPPAQQDRKTSSFPQSSEELLRRLQQV